MSTFLSRICDSTEDFKNDRGSGLDGKHKVDDASNAVVTYAYMADALDSCRIGYSLDDYRIWSDALVLDNHGTEDCITVTLWADGFDDKNDESSMDVYYDEYGVDNFYNNFAITTLGVHFKAKAKWDDLLVDCYVPSASITTDVVDRLVSAICFCHEEHCSLSEALQHFKERVPELAIELQMSVEDIEQKFGDDLGYLGLSVSGSSDDRLVIEASEDDIARVISEVNSGLKLEDHDLSADGGSLYLAAVGMEDAFGGNFVVSIPITPKTTLAELRTLVPTGDLEFPSEVAEDSAGHEDGSADQLVVSDSGFEGWDRDDDSPFHEVIYTKRSTLGKPIEFVSVFMDRDDEGIARHWIDIEGLRGFLPEDLLNALGSTSLPDLEDAQELAEFIMESYNDFYAGVYGKMSGLVI